MTDRTMTECLHGVAGECQCCRDVISAGVRIGLYPESALEQFASPVRGGPQVVAWDDPRGGWVLDTAQQVVCVHKQTTWGNGIHVCNDCRKILS